MKTKGELHLRLKHCLQTIVDLEIDISALSTYISFHDELKSINDFINKIENIDISESDVLRLEKAVETFLNELKLPMAKSMGEIYKGKRLQ